ncbi:membrane-associated protein, putative [Bodo saltans]|uniref:Membrane-associated protein, putative n=1 Tax=Bodo saltans TaxID=75058 RepID=A0A0S4JMB3_BODSA|nr:membrane-associated protein, putative [Bodo saltans]|eukprot:CUG91539.1 membrane-associated protein, putative [Bodo saltans]
MSLQPQKTSGWPREGQQHQRTSSSASLDDSSSDVVIVSHNASPNASTAPSSLSYTVELFENERWFPLSGWCPKRLPSDRPHFSSKDGKTALDPLKWTMPHGYEWIGDWTIDKEHAKGNDAEGWRYGFAWGTHFQPTMTGSTFVRRRRWMRTMIRPPTTTTMTTTLANGEEATKQATWDSQTNRAVATTADNTTPAAATAGGIVPPGDVPVSSQPHAQNKRATSSRRSDEGPLSSAAAPMPLSSSQSATPSAVVVATAPPAAAATTADIYEEEEWDAEPSVATSASMRYFAERQATSSVIGGNRTRSDVQTHTDDAAPTQHQRDFFFCVKPLAVSLAVIVLGVMPKRIRTRRHQHSNISERMKTTMQLRGVVLLAPDDVKDERDDPQQQVVTGTWEEATTPPPAAAAAEASKPQRNPFAPDDDEDAAFYGIAAGGATQAKVTYAPVAFGAASAIQVYPSGSGAAPAPAEPQQQHDNNALSFQRTLTEIVEDVDRSDAQDQQVWEDQQQQQGQGYGGSFAGNSPFLPRKHNNAVSFGGGALSAATTTTTSEPQHDEEDAFANMLMHFVSKAKDGE